MLKMGAALTGNVADAASSPVYADLKAQVEASGGPGAWGVLLQTYDADSSGALSYSELDTAFADGALSVNQSTGELVYDASQLGIGVRQEQVPPAPPPAPAPADSGSQDSALNPYDGDYNWKDFFDINPF